MDTKIRPNDIVKHIPSGEEWVVCGVNYDECFPGLVPCGYPFPSLANIGDCELIERGNGIQSEEYKEALRRHGMERFIERS